MANPRKRAELVDGPETVADAHRLATVLEERVGETPGQPAEVGRCIIPGSRGIGEHFDVT